MGDSEAGLSAQSFGMKLDRLFQSVRREDGERYSKSQVAEAIGVSRGYLYELLNDRYDPGYNVVVKLATFFQVDLEYFADSERASELNRQYELLAKLGESEVNRLATRASQLTPDALSSVLDYIDFQATKGEQEHE